jgi:O-antigen/teichoic acid export membrane protein
VKPLTKNILSLLLGDILYRVLGFIAVVYLARVLDQGGFGIISFCLAILSYALIASNNGLTVIGTRIVSGKSGDINPTINSIILLRIIHGAAAWLILTIIFYFIYGLNELFFVIAIYLCYLIPSALIIEWFFQGKEQMLIISAGRIISIAGYLIFLYFFVTTKEQLILTPVGFVLGAGINALFLIIMFYLSGQRLRFRFMIRQIKTLWFQSIPLSLSSSLSQFVLQLPPVLLAMLCSFESVGIYSVAFRLISIILVFDRLLSFLFFPAVCRWIQFKVDLKEYLKRSVRIVIAFSFMVTLIFLLLAKTIVELTFGESYRESVLVFQILTGYACLTFINTIFSYTLIALKKENVYLRSLIWGAAGFILCLISLSGSMGEAAPAIGLIAFDFISLLIMNQNLKQWISVKTSLIITILLVLTFILAWPLLLIFNFPIYINFVIAFIIIIPLIKILTSIRISDLMYLKKITI